MVDVKVLYATAELAYVDRACLPIFYAKIIKIAKFHYTGATGPDRTKSADVGDPRGPNELCRRHGSGPVCAVDRISYIASCHHLLHKITVLEIDLTIDSYLSAFLE